MDYNKATVLVGKVRNFNETTGEIVAKEGIYLFTQDEISEGEVITINDMVLFRGEEVQGQKKAYFIKKLNPEKDLNNQIYTKTKSIKKYIDDNGIDIDIEVDGGINLDNVEMVKAAGANMIVSGTAIVNSTDRAFVISQMKK